MNNKVLKIVHIAANYGETHDGIGAYSKIIDSAFSSNIQVIPCTSVCKNYANKISKIFDFGMTNKIWHSVFLFKKDDADIYLIEYPFMDWNPLFIIPMLALKIRIVKGKKHLVLSLHEYDRVNFLRKAVIRVLYLFSDIIFVSDDNMIDVIGAKKKSYIRPIPTNIFNKSILNFDVSVKEKNHYAFFGLISNTKAFNEMITAWDIFNKDGKKQLDIITSSVMTGLDKHYNVNYIYNADDNKIMNILKIVSFCIVPIKPEVDAKNASFKTRVLAGCISIGKFCKEYSDKKFVINMADYSVDEFVRCFEIADNKAVGDLTDLYIDAHKFGLNFLPANVAGKIEDILENEVKSNADLH